MNIDNLDSNSQYIDIEIAVCQQLKNRNKIKRILTFSLLD